jgi:hypothetical protein
MKNITHYLAAIALTAWVGSLWAVGYLAIPVLFHAQADKQLAGMLAGQLFSTAAYLGLMCGAYLLLFKFSQSGKDSLRDSTFWVVIIMLLITFCIQFGIQPVMADLKTQALPLDVMSSPFADRFKMLHGISSIVFLIESLLGGYLVIKKQRPDK